MAKPPGSSGADPQPIRGQLGASILGPRNKLVERENPDQFASPIPIPALSRI